eukprot:GILI01015487.1.p2 GENE.GILI01015487.1~~GILI01015487.1.p2  ORF type:complete len:141 (-),score=22.58 GILI01015487.1:265-687(-)
MQNAQLKAQSTGYKLCKTSSTVWLKMFHSGLLTTPFKDPGTLSTIQLPVGPAAPEAGPLPFLTIFFLREDGGGIKARLPMGRAARDGSGRGDWNEEEEEEEGESEVDEVEVEEEVEEEIDEVSAIIEASEAGEAEGRESD